MVETISGRVVIAYSQDSLVESADGTLYRCQSRRSVGKPVCGDYVRFTASGADSGVLTQIEPRRNVIARPNFRNELRPIAANVDLMVVVVAPRPAFERILIDRYLVLAEQLDVTALVWVNKLDMLAPAQQRELLDSLAVYRKLGYHVLGGSTVSGEGIAELQNALAGRTAILVGQSGVGKSSLVKRLIPDIDLRIGALSDASGLGRHTTTETTLYHLPAGGSLIDSPGIRTLRLSHLDPQALQAGFREIRELAARCRFPDCRHRGEPDCAVAGGGVDPERLRNFHLLLDTEAGKA